MAQTVDEYLAALDNPMKEAVVALRDLLVAADPSSELGIKWNAPSYGRDGEHRVTFNISPKGDRFKLVFHRGAKVREDAFSFADSAGLLEWVADDRATVTFGGLEDVSSRGTAVVELVGRWIDATV